MVEIKDEIKEHLCDILTIIFVSIVSFYTVRPLCTGIINKFVRKKGEN
jgi:hypothetical protein